MTVVVLQDMKTASYLERHHQDDITRRLNEIFEADPEAAELDPVLKELQYRSLPKEEW